MHACAKRVVREGPNMTLVLEMAPGEKWRLDAPSEWGVSAGACGCMHMWFRTVYTSELLRLGSALLVCKKPQRCHSALLDL